MNEDQHPASGARGFVADGHGEAGLDLDELQRGCRAVPASHRGWSGIRRVGRGGENREGQYEAGQPPPY
jgi:hypothetical protein